MRSSVTSGRDARGQVCEVLHRHAGVEPRLLLPDDRAACDQALALARTLREVAPAAPLRLALRELACALAGLPAPTHGRRRRERT
jgi:hypothetical protein